MQDEELLTELRDQISKVDFVKLKRAVEATTMFGTLPTLILKTIPSGSNYDKDQLSSNVQLKITNLENQIKSLSIKNRGENMKKLEAELAELQSCSFSSVDVLRIRDEEQQLKSKIAKTKERKCLIKDLDGRLREAASLDICFMIDCTGSMSRHLK